MYKIAHAFTNARQVSVQEAAYVCLSYFICQHQHTF